MKVVWFKRDLRLHDHEALHEALSTSGKTLLLYIFEPSLMKDYHYSQRHFDFIKQSLEALQKELQKYHTQILIVQGEATTIFKKLSEQIEISTVYSHQETGIKLTYERDLAVVELLKEKGIIWKEYITNGVIRGIKNRKTWKEDWYDYMDKDCLPFQPTPRSFIKYIEIEELENGETQIIGGREVVIFQPHQYKINKVQPHKKALKETWATGSLVNQGGSAAEFLHLYLKDRKSIDGLNILYKVIGMGTKGDGLGFRYITGPKKETAVNGKFYTGLPIDKQDDEIKEKAIPINNLLLEEDIYSNQFWDFKDNFGNCRTQGGVSFNGGKKPEQLLQRIIEISTNENDIVLDYHLGSGTTAAVAHKMNRQYIGIEQMDYIETLAVERLKKVIDGEQGGISKAVNWQGGGEFVYAELAPFNETAKQQILACENIDDIKTLFNKLCERYFLKYNVSVNEFSQIIEEPEFQSLPLDEQKQMVLEMLDLNQMYVSLSEMDDEQFAGCLNDDDKALSREFYQSAKNQAEKKDGE